MKSLFVCLFCWLLPIYGENILYKIYDVQKKAIKKDRYIDYFKFVNTMAYKNKFLPLNNLEDTTFVINFYRGNVGIYNVILFNSKDTITVEYKDSTEISVVPQDFFNSFFFSRVYTWDKKWFNRDSNKLHGYYIYISRVIKKQNAFKIDCVKINARNEYVY